MSSLHQCDQIRRSKNKTHKYKTLHSNVYTDDSLFIGMSGVVTNHGLNTLRQRRNRSHFADDIFKWIFLNENIWILIWISLKFIPKCPVDLIPALVQIMARCRPGDKSLSEPMMVRSLTHICVTRPQWVNLCLLRGCYISKLLDDILKSHKT